MSETQAEKTVEKNPKRFHLSGIRRMMLSGGYGNFGANTTKNATIGWLMNGGSPEEDIDRNTAVLRQRARDLDVNGGLARGANITMTTNIVGVGLVPKPKPDGKLLGLKEKEAAEWIDTCKREFELWAGSKKCGADLQMDFFQLQELAMRSQLVSGDSFALLPMFQTPGTPYQTHVRLLEADRICTENCGYGGVGSVRELQDGGKIVDGVEMDKSGVVVAFWIADRHPLGMSGAAIKWTRVEAYGKNTGMPNVLHMMKFERPEQRRGVPFISAMILTLKQLTRYTEAELMSNVIRAMFTVFIKQSTEGAGSTGTIDEIVGEAERVTQSDERLELGAGAVIQLKPGEDIISANPGGPNTNYDKYFESLCLLIASSLGIPKSILIKKFESNYTAARGELLEFWKEVRLWRMGLVRDFCQPCYEAFLAEAVATGRIAAPGFFESDAARAAWCKVQWQGSTMGSVDPKKEADAAMIRINGNLSTGEREAAEINGSDFFENAAQRDREIKAAPKTGAVPVEQDPNSDDEEEGKEDA